MPTRADERADVSAANLAFYAALESLDPDRMAAVWLRESYITCTNRGRRRLMGWGPVMKNWEDIFASTFGLKVAITDEVVHVHGDLAWVTCTETVENRGYDGIAEDIVEATNVLERRGGKWFLVHHHSSPRTPGHGSEEGQLQ